MNKQTQTGPGENVGQQATIVRCLSGLVALLLAGCTHIEIGMGENHGGDWEDMGRAGSYLAFIHHRQVSENIDLEVAVRHYSQWSSGFPANSESGESTLNHVGVNLRFTLPERRRSVLPRRFLD